MKDYGEFDSAILEGAADILIDHVEFRYAEAAQGKSKRQGEIFI